MGELNPLPWAFMTGNTCGWVAYAFLTKNIFVFIGNAPSFLLSIWLNIGACQLQYWEDGTNILLPVRRRRQSCSSSGSDNVTSTNNKERQGLSEPLLVADERPLQEAATLTHSHNSSRHTTIKQKPIFLSVGAIWLLLLSIVAFFPQFNQVLTVGIAANINLVFFLAAPLSTILTVLKSRNSESIHGPTMLASIANCSLW